MTCSSPASPDDCYYETCSWLLSPIICWFAFWLSPIIYRFRFCNLLRVIISDSFLLLSRTCCEGMAEPVPGQLIAQFIIGTHQFIEYTEISIVTCTPFALYRYHMFGSNHTRTQ